MSKPAPYLSALSGAIKLTVVILGLGYIGEKVADYHNVPFAVGSASHNVLIVFAFWADLLRPGFALCALWEASNIFANVGKGTAFGPALIKGMKGIGLNLMFGGIGALGPWCRCFTWLSYGRLPPMAYGMHIESLTFGLIGLVFYMLARHGKAVTSELEQYV